MLQLPSRSIIKSMKEYFVKAMKKSENFPDDFIAEMERTWAQQNEFDRVSQRQELDQFVSDTEEKIESLTKYEEVIQRWLSRYGINKEVRKNELGQLEIAAPELPESIPNLPTDYGYKGGAARAILEHALGLPYSEPRDLDIVFLGEKEDKIISKQLANRYMPEDYAYGHGVEPLEDNYFETRDFTLNEVLYDGQKIICTRQCLTDLMRNIVRFTDYEKSDSFRGDRFFINPKLLAKAVRMVAYARDKGKKLASITNEIDSLQELYIDDFHLALHLDRAMEQGAGVASEYVRIMNEKGFIPSKIETPAACLKYLLGRTKFIFRCCRKSEIDSESEFIKELEDKFLENTPLSPVPFWKQKRTE